MLGDGITERDIVKIHIKARAEGKPAANPLDTAPRATDLSIHRWMHPDWGRVGMYANGDGHKSYRVREFEDRRILRVMIEARRTTDARAKIPSKLFTDYCYVTVEREGYVYEYHWDDIPDGTEAAVILECSSNTPNQVGNSPVPVINGRSISGVEVDSVDMSIIANREG